MSENQVVIFPRGKVVHIVRSEGYTLCGECIPNGSEIFNSDPDPNLDYCRGCLIYVGKEMLTEYMGQVFFDTPQPSTRYASSRLLSEETKSAKAALKDIRSSLSSMKHRRRTT